MKTFYKSNFKKILKIKFSTNVLHIATQALNLRKGQVQGIQPHESQTTSSKKPLELSFLGNFNKELKKEDIKTSIVSSGQETMISFLPNEDDQHVGYFRILIKKKKYKLKLSLKLVSKSTIFYGVDSKNPSLVETGRYLIYFL